MSKTLDYPDLRLHEQNAWVRLRDEGDKITLIFKQRLGGKGRDGKTNDTGMKEIEVVVSDFEKTAQIFYSIGLTDKFIEEKRRIRYMLNGIEFDIDYMPALKPYLEIEAGSMEEVEKGIKLLGLDPDEKKVFSAFRNPAYLYHSKHRPEKRLAFRLITGSFTKKFKNSPD